MSDDGGDSARYTFPPVERRGVVLGLDGLQLGVLTGGVALALGLLRSGRGTVSLVVALVVMAASATAALVPLAGRPPVAWAPSVLAWVMHGRARRLAPAPAAGRHSGASAPGRHSGAPAPGRHSGTRVRGPDHRQGQGGSLAPAGIRVVAAAAVPGEDELGMIQDRRTGAWSGVLAVHGRSLTLLDESDQARRLASWGGLLAGVARPGSAVHRLQWVERTVPADADALDRYAQDAAVVDVDSASGCSYREFIAGEGPVATDHQAFLVLTVRPRRHRPTAGGSGATAAGRMTASRSAAVAEILRRELRLLRGQLRQADLRVSEPLTRSGLLAALAAGSDPDRRLAPPAGRADEEAWPLGAREHWGAVQLDGRWAATFWVADWPRVAVAPDFLSPLLMGGGRRAIAMTMAPIPPDRAIREVESARTADAADEELRRRAGFVSTARREREAAGVRQRERELAEGHADYRYTGYLTVSGGTRIEMEAACAEVEQSARQAFLVLRRLYGRQAEAFTWTLPVGRGLT